MIVWKYAMCTIPDRHEFLPRMRIGMKPWYCWFGVAHLGLTIYLPSAGVEMSIPLPASQWIFIIIRLQWSGGGVILQQRIISPVIFIYFLNRNWWMLNWKVGILVYWPLWVSWLFVLVQMWNEVCAFGDGSNPTTHRLCNHTRIQLFRRCHFYHCQGYEVELP